MGAMSLLTLEQVSMRCGSDDCRDRVALHDISLDVDPGELVTVAGRRCSGRTALLRVAAGVDAADGGHGPLRRRRPHAPPDARQAQRDRRMR